MKTFTRAYYALCLLGLAGFAWAEYNGWVLTGDDEAMRLPGQHSTSVSHK